MVTSGNSGMSDHRPSGVDAVVSMYGNIREPSSEYPLALSWRRAPGAHRLTWRSPREDQCPRRLNEARTAARAGLVLSRWEAALQAWRTVAGSRWPKWAPMAAK